MSVDFYETTSLNMPEDCDLNTRRHENLKSHLYKNHILSRMSVRYSHNSFFLEQSVQ
jgi:hypothetical protein